MSTPPAEPQSLPPPLLPAPPPLPACSVHRAAGSQAPPSWPGRPLIGRKPSDAGRGRRHQGRSRSPEGERERQVSDVTDDVSRTTNQSPFVFLSILYFYFRFIVFKRVNRPE